MLSHLLFCGLQDGDKLEERGEVRFLNLTAYQGNNNYGDMITTVAIHSRVFI